MLRISVGRGRAVLTVRDHNVEDYAALRDMDATDVAVLDGASTSSPPMHVSDSGSGCCTNILNRPQERCLWKASLRHPAEL